jgi:hypothetical protein
MKRVDLDDAMTGINRSASRSERHFDGASDEIATYLPEVVIAAGTAPGTGPGFSRGHGVSSGLEDFSARIL